MYKIVFKNFLLPVLLLIVSVLLSVAVAFIGLGIPAVTLPAWLLIGVVFVISVIATVAMYPRGEIKHYLMLAGIIFGFYLLAMIIVSGVAIALSKGDILILSAGDLKINVVSLVLPVIAAVIAAKLLVKIEYEKLAELKQETKVEPVVQKEVTQVLEEQSVEMKQEEPMVEQVVEAKQPEIKEELASPQESFQEEIFFEDIAEEEPPQETVLEEAKPDEESQEEIFFEDIMEEKPTQEHIVEEAKPDEESQEEIFFEDIMEEKPENDVTPVVVEPDYSDVKVQEPDLGDLGELPSLDADLDDLSEDEEEVEEKEELVVSFEPESDEEEDEIVVTEDEKTSDKLVMHKLADKPSSKEVETGGKISAIGKLLVDQRDIENIIETNALMQSVGADSTTTNIISVTEGAKLNESLDALKDIEGVMSCVVVNDAGFIQASSIDDMHKEQVIGAMASGVFGVVSNSLTKIGFSALKDIAFESETGNLSLSKSKGKIFAVFTSSDASLYLMDDINDFLTTAAEREPEDLMSSISSLNGIIGAVLASGNGQLIASKLIDDSKKPNEIADILPAFYSNLGVFIKNMDQGILRKAVVATSSEILLLTSIGDNILMAYATINTSILPKDIKIQYETILNL